VGAAPAAGRAGKGRLATAATAPRPGSSRRARSVLQYSPSVEPAANVHGCGWGCTKQVGGGVRRRRRLRAACSAASSRREALSPGAAAKATRTACTTKITLDHPDHPMIARSPEITRDLPRSPERRGSPARHAAGRSAPAAAQTRRTRADGPRERHRPAQRGRRSQGRTSSGAQTRRRPVPPRARPAPPRRRAVLCSRRRRTAAPGAGAVALALRCLLAGGRGAPPAPGGMCHGHVMDTEGPSLGGLRHNDGLPLLRTSRAETPAGSSQNLESSTAVHHQTSIRQAWC
jgi:hypothetical protein